MDDAQLRRHLSAPRAVVLDILGDQGYADSTQILHAWIGRKPAMTEAHRRRLPRMVGEVVWRLKNLEWIRDTAGTYSLTELGERARTHARTPR